MAHTIAQESHNRAKEASVCVALLVGPLQYLSPCRIPKAQRELWGLQQLLQLCNCRSLARHVARWWCSVRRCLFFWSSVRTRLHLAQVGFAVWELGANWPINDRHRCRVSGQCERYKSYWAGTRWYHDHAATSDSPAGCEERGRCWSNKLWAKGGFLTCCELLRKWRGTTFWCGRPIHRRFGARRYIFCLISRTVFLQFAKQ
mmetsp:Transcript_29168/g.67137  ORF Transcript_29168/g.67137 Transcript_29168/m.67137 type:complete len:202 (+) Transcript_29168:552-1157(+)